MASQSWEHKQQRSLLQETKLKTVFINLMLALQNMIDAVGCCFFTLVFGTSGSMAIGLHNSHER